MVGCLEGFPACLNDGWGVGAQPNPLRFRLGRTTPPHPMGGDRWHGTHHMKVQGGHGALKAIEGRNAKRYEMHSLK